MKISAKIDYACRALIELSIHWPAHTPVKVRVISERQKIPMQFLTHILIHLRQAGFVESLRGKAGGYILKKSPRDILLSEVVECFGGLGITNVYDHSGKRRYAIDDIWQDIDIAILNKLREFDFKEITNRYQQQTKALMFEI